MVTDISEALAATTDYATQSANRTLQGIFGSRLFDTSKLILDLMYKGELPVEEYQRNIDIDEEFEFFDKALYNLKIAVSFDLAFSCLFLVILIGFLIVYRSIHQSWTMTKAVEKAKKKKLAKKKKKDREIADATKFVKTIQKL